jgi:hypothetical protein
MSDGLFTSSCQNRFNSTIFARCNVKSDSHIEIIFCNSFNASMGVESFVASSPELEKREVVNSLVHAQCLS